jgi:hypothetical protein
MCELYECASSWLYYAHATLDYCTIRSLWHINLAVVQLDAVIRNIVLSIKFTDYSARLVILRCAAQLNHHTIIWSCFVIWHFYCAVNAFRVELCKGARVILLLLSTLLVLLLPLLLLILLASAVTRRCHYDARYRSVAWWIGVRSSASLWHTILLAMHDTSSSQARW